MVYLCLEVSGVAGGLTSVLKDAPLPVYVPHVCPSI